MKKKLMLFTLLSVSAFADEAATQKLLNAVTVCSSASNPLTAMTVYNGNSFGNVAIEADTGAITADVVYDPRLQNPLVGAPTRIVGRVRVEMKYPAPGYGLECKVSEL